jgi:hypothetical protein
MVRNSFVSYAHLHRGIVGPKYYFSTISSMSGTEHSKENDEHIDKKRKLNGSHFTLCERPITELVE